MVNDLLRLPSCPSGASTGIFVGLVAPTAAVAAPSVNRSQQICFKNGRSGETAFLGVFASLLHVRQNNKAGGIKGRVMKFLLKAAFWLSIVVMLLPSGEKPAPAP